MPGTIASLGGQAAEVTTDNLPKRHPRDKLTILLYVKNQEKLQEGNP